MLVFDPKKAFYPQAYMGPLGRAFFVFETRNDPGGLLGNDALVGGVTMHSTCIPLCDKPIEPRAKLVSIFLSK